MMTKGHAHLWRLVPVALAALVCVVATGCKSVPAEEPLVLSLDLLGAQGKPKDSYKVGEPLIVKVILENQTGKTVIVPAFAPPQLKFMYGAIGAAPRLHRKPLTSKLTQLMPREVQPFDRTHRVFLFTLMTQDAGEFVMTALLKNAIIGEKVHRHAIYATPKPFKVAEEVMFARNPSDGLIKKDQALKIALARIGGKVTFSRIYFDALEKGSGLWAWYVQIIEQQPNGTSRKYLIMVNPYDGRAKTLTKLDTRPEAPRRTHRRKAPTRTGEIGTK